jgi:hypothetical protein
MIDTILIYDTIVVHWRNGWKWMETDGNGWSFGPEVIFHQVPVLLDPKIVPKRCPEATTGRRASSTFLVNDHLLQDGRDFVSTIQDAN